MRLEWEALVANLDISKWTVADRENSYAFFCHGWFGRTCDAAYQSAGDREPATDKTPDESTLASATGSVEWEPAAHKPPSYQSVLVYGVLESEQSADTHEGYWTGQRWQSVRRDDDISALRKLKLLNVTHWACRPTPPNDQALPRCGANQQPKD